MKRTVTVPLLLILLFVSLFPIAQADVPEPLIITPYVGGPEFTAAAGQEVIIRAGWGTCIRGPAQAFTRATSISMEVSMNDIPWLTVGPTAREYWGPVEPQTGDTSACIMPVDHGWQTEWLYSLGNLAAGTYDVHFVWTLAHPLPDGGDYDGDGKLDFAYGTIADRLITIQVE